MQDAAGGGWWPLSAAVVGLVLGAAASTVTRRFLTRERAVAGSWWLGGVVTAAVLALLAWRVKGHGELAVYGFVTTLGIPLAVIDWSEHRLPRALVWAQLVGVLAGFTVLCLIRGDAAPGVRALVASLAVAGVFLVLALVTAGGVGAGDVRLAAVTGAVTGWSGWSQVAGASLAASLLALLLIVLPGARRRDERGQAVVPFGPCLLGATLTILAIAS